MADFVHARRRDGKIVFRVWNTVVDKYENDEPLSRDEVRQYLLDGEAQSPVRQSSNAALDAAMQLLAGTGMLVHDARTSGGVAIEVEARLDRAERNGTSSRMGDKADLDGPWDTEMCGECGAFHHAFKPRDDADRCDGCGEPEDDRGHRPACAKGSRGSR